MPRSPQRGNGSPPYPRARREGPIGSDLGVDWGGRPRVTAHLGWALEATSREANLFGQARPLLASTPHEELHATHLDGFLAPGQGPGQTTRTRGRGRKLKSVVIYASTETVEVSSRVLQHCQDSRVREEAHAGVPRHHNVWTVGLLHCLIDGLDQGNLKSAQWRASTELRNLVKQSKVVGDQIRGQGPLGRR